MSGFVYLIQPVGGGPIYLGHAGDPQQRFVSHQRSSPVRLRLLGVREATRVDEAELHRRLRRLRIRGSWYPDCALVRAALETVEVPDTSILEGPGLFEAFEAFLRDATPDLLQRAAADSKLAPEFFEEIASRVLEVLPLCYAEWRDRLLAASATSSLFAKRCQEFYAAIGEAA